MTYTVLSYMARDKQGRLISGFFQNRSGEADVGPRWKNGIAFWPKVPTPNLWHPEETGEKKTPRRTHV